MRLDVDELRRLLGAAMRTGRPVDVDWNNQTLTILEHDRDGAKKLYVVRDNPRSGVVSVVDRT